MQRTRQKSKTRVSIVFPRCISIFITRTHVKDQHVFRTVLQEGETYKCQVFVEHTDVHGETAGAQPVVQNLVHMGDTLWGVRVRKLQLTFDTYFPQQNLPGARDISLQCYFQHKILWFTVLCIAVASCSSLCSYTHLHSVGGCIATFVQENKILSLENLAR